MLILNVNTYQNCLSVWRYTSAKAKFRLTSFYPPHINTQFYKQSTLLKYTGYNAMSNPIHNSSQNRITSPSLSSTPLGAIGGTGISKQRESHKRKDIVNEKIQELATIIPESFLLAPVKSQTAGTVLTSPQFHPVNTGTKDKRPNKGTILIKSVEYIKMLQQLIDEQNRQEVELQDQLRNLEVTSGLDPSDFATTSAEKALANLGVLSADEEDEDDTGNDGRPRVSIDPGISINGGDIVLGEEEDGSDLLSPTQSISVSTPSNQLTRIASIASPRSPRSPLGGNIQSASNNLSPQHPVLSQLNRMDSRNSPGTVVSMNPNANMNPTVNMNLSSFQQPQISSRAQLRTQSHHQQQSQMTTQSRPQSFPYENFDSLDQIQFDQFLTDDFNSLNYLQDFSNDTGTINMNGSNNNPAGWK